MGLDHQAVARDLREDRSRGDRDAQPVAFNDHPLFDGDSGQPNGIKEEEIRRGGKLEQGLFHGTTCGLPDIDRINDLCVYDSHTKAERHIPDQVIESLPLSLVQPLRVTKPDERTAAPRKDDRSCDDRSRKRSAPDFVQASYTPKPSNPRFVLEEFIRRQWHRRESYAPAGTSAAAGPTGAESCFALPSARYSRSATRAILPFFVRK
jgi:hypothetical protein